MKNLKEKLKGKHLDILFAMFLALTVQVFNTANLYAHISGLIDLEKIVACYFIGLSAEFAIFICIYNGSRSAGAWFALMTFFVGMMFHSWDLNAVNIDFMNYENSEFNIGKKFVASLLLQGINSLLVWFLSELYVDKIEENNKQHNISELEQKLSTLNQSQSEAEQRLSEVLQQISLEEKRKTELQKKITQGERMVSESEESVKAMEQEIVKLKRSKAGMSKGAGFETSVENNG